MDEFAHFLLSNDTSIKEFMENHNGELVELIETGSAELTVCGKKFVFFRHTAPSPSHRIERYDVTRALAEFDADEMHR